jgi:hypothetical protein
MSMLNSSKKILCSPRGISENTRLLESSAVWRYKKQNTFAFIDRQPKKAVLGLLNAEGEVTMIFRTAGNYLLINTALYLRGRKYPNIVLLALLNSLNYQKSLQICTWIHFVGYTHFLNLHTTFSPSFKITAHTRLQLYF